MAYQVTVGSKLQLNKYAEISQEMCSDFGKEKFLFAELLYNEHRKGNCYIEGKIVI